MIFLDVKYYKRIEQCKDNRDAIYEALNSMYGIDIAQDNIDEMKNRIIDIVKNYNHSLNVEKVIDILNKNIICADALEFDYESI